MTSVGNMFLNLDSFQEDEVNGLDIKRLDVQDMLLNYKSYTENEFLNKFPFLGKDQKQFTLVLCWPIVSLNDWEW